MVRKTCSRGRRASAWVEGQAGQGIGEWIAIEFDGLRTVRSIVVRNGYQKSNDIFRKNNRVRQLRAVFSQGETQTLDRARPFRVGTADAAQAGAGPIGSSSSSTTSGPATNIPTPRSPNWWSIRSGCSEPRASARRISDARSVPPLLLSASWQPPRRRRRRCPAILSFCATSIRPSSRTSAMPGRTISSAAGFRATTRPNAW